MHTLIKIHKPYLLSICSDLFKIEYTSGLLLSQILIIFTPNYLRSSKHFTEAKGMDVWCAHKWGGEPGYARH